MFPFKTLTPALIMRLKVRQTQKIEQPPILQRDTRYLQRNQCISCHSIFPLICLPQVETCGFCSLRKGFWFKDTYK